MLLTPALLLLTCGLFGDASAPLKPEAAADSTPMTLPSTDPGKEARLKAAERLRAVLDAGAEAGVPELLKACEEAAGLLPESSRNRMRMLAMVQEQRADLEKQKPDRVLRDTRRGVEGAMLDLSFEPRIEAPVPVGWPAPTTVNELMVLDYPAYRLARAPMSGQTRTNSAFWKLFRHIESNQIPMTAPVETTYAGGKGEEEPQWMAFLYQSTQQGSLGKDGEVEIVDLPAARVLSIGRRGSMSERAMKSSRIEMDAWLAANAQWEVCGPMRSMGWNSPMVPDARRYWEIQLPVRLKTVAAK
ncbi:MAG: heme-binding protein [Planctomycetia bacterium]